MSGAGGGAEVAAAAEAAPGGGGRKRDSAGTAGSAVQLIIKDLGEVHARLLDHRPIVQGEARYFVKEFEERRGLRELRVLENLRGTIEETARLGLPRCRDALGASLSPVLQALRSASEAAGRLQQREQQRREAREEHLLAAERGRRAQWEAFAQEQRGQRAALDAEHGRALARLREQYARMDEDLARFSAF